MLTEDAIEELKAKHGDKIEAICHDGTGEILAVVRPPTAGEYDRFMAMILDDEKKPHAMKTLVRTCLLWPEMDSLKDRPALISTIGGQLHELAGSVKSVSRKKL